MAATCTELFKSRDVQLGVNPTAELRFVIDGTEDHDEALSTLLATAPTNVSGIPRHSWRVEPINLTMWFGTMRYGQQVRSTGDSVYQFDTGGGQQHITNSIATPARYAPAGRTAPNFQGAIGVSKDSVQGVDVTVPVYNWTEVKYHDDNDIDAAYKATLFALTGKVNNATWNGYAPGEVLFQGAAGSQRGNDDWEVAYRFAASPNLTGLVIGSITGISKLGWEYLWVQYEDVEDATARMLIKQPASVHVEQVYNYADFSGLKV